MSQIMLLFSYLKLSSGFPNVLKIQTLHHNQQVVLTQTSAPNMDLTFLSLKFHKCWSFTLFSVKSAMFRIAPGRFKKSLNLVDAS